jgi:hypothetical protein
MDLQAAYSKDMLSKFRTGHELRIKAFWGRNFLRLALLIAIEPYKA